MEQKEVSLRRLYSGLLVSIGIAFAAVNIIGYGLRWSFFPSHLKYGVIEDFLFMVRTDDIGHAIELLSPEIEVIKDPRGDMIGLAHGSQFWSFRELKLCKVDEETAYNYSLTNGANIEVSNRGRILLKKGKRIFPWDERQFLKQRVPDQTATVIRYLREHIEDDSCWLMGMSELSSLTGKATRAAADAPRGERHRILDSLTR
jgi:hypothetical protein